jgi:XTP/dITP diphosphohydrolase
VSAPDGRIVLLVTSPRVAAGLLAWPAWQRLVTADAVLACDPDPFWLQALEQAGIAVEDVGQYPVARRAGRLVELAVPGHEAVWLGSPDGDPGLTDAIAEHLARKAIAGRPPEIELITGSHDVSGARLLDLVAVMDRLRSPGGCPWDAEQTHRSLLPYLLEEAHEVVEAVESGDRAHLLEELGDLLLQVVFHARLAEEDDTDPFDVDDVAAGIVGKLVRRHPHVFADTQVDGPEQVHHNWEQIKAAEKQRSGLFDGVPVTLPALARAQKMLSRLERAAGADGVAEFTAAAGGDQVAARLLQAVALAAAEGADAEGALREALRRLAETRDGAAPRSATPGADAGTGTEAGP